MAVSMQKGPSRGKPRSTSDPTTPSGAQNREPLRPEKFSSPPHTKQTAVALALSMAGVALIIVAALTRELRFTLSAGFFCIGIAQLLILRSPAEPLRHRKPRVFMAILVLVLAALNIWQPWEH